MHEKRFKRTIEKLREPERLKLLEVDRVIDLAIQGIKVNASVLDIGTGSGVFAERFVEKGFTVTGLDANPEMLPIAQKYVPKSQFREGIAEDLPFSDRSFDLVFMGLLLHETDDPQKAVKESFRVARSRLVILEWPKEIQEHGPSLSERLSEQEIITFGSTAGFAKIAPISLASLILYILEK